VAGERPCGCGPVSERQVVRMLDDILKPVDAPPEHVGNPDGLPWVTHAGVLRLGGVELRCYQLSDGRRVFDGEDVARQLGGLSDEELEAAKRAWAKEAPK
jgi:hypothetical protein